MVEKIKCKNTECKHLLRYNELGEEKRVCGLDGEIEINDEGKCAMIEFHDREFLEWCRNCELDKDTTVCLQCMRKIIETQTSKIPQPPNWMEYTG